MDDQSIPQETTQLEVVYKDDLSLRNEFAQDIDKWKKLQKLKKDLKEEEEKVLEAFNKSRQSEIRQIMELEEHFKAQYERLRAHAEMGTMNSERRRYMGGIVQTSLRKRPKIKDAVRLLEWAQEHPLTMKIPTGKQGKLDVLTYVRESKPELLEVDLDLAADLALTPSYVYALEPSQRPDQDIVETEYYPTLPSMDTFAKVMAMIDIEVTVDDRSEH